MFEGSLLCWADEDARIYDILLLGNQRAVTRYISRINIASSGQYGRLIVTRPRATAFHSHPIRTTRR
jgi:acyl-CoA thioesterase YciA